ncbi:MAG: carbonic anhydrase [Anaerolineae bacterium]|nr:MAG: carbonic anhydrase [Anaerolineae bacterium]
MSVSPAEALERLKAGNLRFQNNEPHTYVRVLEDFDVDPQSQDPFAAVLTCSDSRVVCEMLFDTGIGDLFVARLAGNIASPEALGSLEFAVNALGVNLILVLGHENCGAIKAAMSGESYAGHLEEVIGVIRPAVVGAPDYHAAILANIRQSIEVISRAPLLAARLASGSLAVSGGYYDLDSGSVRFLD